MKRARVRRILLRRLAYLEAKISKGTSAPLVEERDALETALRCLGWLDPERVERHVEHAVDRVLPAEQRTVARAQRGDAMVAQASKLVERLQLAARVA